MVLARDYPNAVQTRHAAALAFLAFLEQRGDLLPNARRRAEGALGAGGERIETILTELGLTGENALLEAMGVLHRLPHP